MEQIELVGGPFCGRVTGGPVTQGMIVLMPPVRFGGDTPPKPGDPTPFLYYRVENPVPGRMLTALYTTKP